MNTTHLRQYCIGLQQHVYKWINAKGADAAKRRVGVACITDDLDFTLQHCDMQDYESAKIALREAFKMAHETHIIRRIGRVILA